jgi:hypothetical protein
VVAHPLAREQAAKSVAQAIALHDFVSLPGAIVEAIRPQFRTNSTGDFLVMPKLNIRE